MDPESVDGWSSVGQNKKGKKMKKKLKNARTLTLQTFFSEHGGQESDSKQGDNSSPELSNEELVYRESLLSYFGDVLKRSGPMKINGPELQSELDRLSEEGKELVNRHSDISAFIAQSSQLVIIDDYICSKESADQARKLALDSIVKMVAARNNKNSSVAPGPTAASTPPASVWNTQSPAAAKAPGSKDTGSWFQTSKVESLFSSNFDSSPSSPTSNSDRFSTNSPSFVNQSCSPSFFQRTSSPSASVNGSSRFGGLGCVSNSESQHQTTIDELNKRIQALSLSNSELLTKLVTKERQLQHFSKLIEPQQELSKNHDKLKLELEEAKKEIANLNKLISTSGTSGDKKSATPPPTDNQLIISLQHQLESERLNSRNLKYQLELERDYAKKLTDKHNYLLNHFHSNKSNPMAPGGPVMGGLGLSQDSFGLRGLLANTSTVYGDEGSRFSSSSSIFSDRPMSFTPAPQPSQSLTNGLKKFSSSFNGIELRSLSDDFHRQVKSPTESKSPFSNGH